MYFKTLKEIKLKREEINDNESAYMIYVGQESVLELKEAMSVFSELGVQFFGGIYPKLIVHGKAVSSGYLIRKVKPLYSELVYPHMMKSVPELESGKAYTGYLFGDGFTEYSTDLIDTIMSKVKGDINYVGGGSAIYSSQLGIHKIEQDRVIFNNNGFHKNAMHLCIVEEESKSHLNLGWDIIAGPFEITKSQDNLIMEIEDENAFEFYASNLSAIEDIIVKQNDSLYYASQYTFGIVENGDLQNVRVPIEINDNGFIRVVSGVTQNTNVYLLRANNDSMINGDVPITEIHDTESSVMMVSCLSRDLFLDEEFEKEIMEVESRTGKPVEGIVTVGEYMNTSEEGIVVYEGATVVNYV